MPALKWELLREQLKRSPEEQQIKSLFCFWITDLLWSRAVSQQGGGSCVRQYRAEDWVGWLGLLTLRAGLLLLPPCLAFLLILRAPFRARAANWGPVVWRQCGERPGPEQLLWAGVCLVEMKPAGEGEKIDALGWNKVTLSCLGCQRYAGVWELLKSRIFLAEGCKPPDYTLLRRGFGTQTK